MNLAGLSPVAFICTRDRASAKAFYGDVLGLPTVSEDPFSLVFDLNGVMLRISDVPDFQPHAHTTLGWLVKDIGATAKALRAKGVSFNFYPGFEQDEDGVWQAPGGSAKVAWFNDPDGNNLSITQF